MVCTKYRAKNRTPSYNTVDSLMKHSGYKTEVDTREM